MGNIVFEYRENIGDERTEEEGNPLHLSMPSCNLSFGPSRPFLPSWYTRAEMTDASSPWFTCAEIIAVSSPRCTNADVAAVSYGPLMPPCQDDRCIILLFDSSVPRWLMHHLAPSYLRAKMTDVSCLLITPGQDDVSSCPFDIFVPRWPTMQHLLIWNAVRKEFMHWGMLRMIPCIEQPN